MSLWRRLFSATYRRARRAEGAGEYRRAAGLYAEAGAAEDAAGALRFLAARASDREERRQALEDALRWLPERHPDRAEVQSRLARMTLEEVRAAGGVSVEMREPLQGAAARLEAAGRWHEAATAWEWLGRGEAAARCLEAAGAVERLEGVLEGLAQREQRERRVRRAVQRYEVGMETGARGEAREALRETLGEAPDDAEITGRLRALEARWLPEDRVVLRCDGRRWLLVGRLPLVLGRVGADVALRGGSVSRRHAELSRRGERLVVRDLESRNGTRLRGVPIAREAELDGPATIGLGDDLDLEVAPFGAEGLHVEVVRGLDCGTVVLAGPRLRPPGWPAELTFPRGTATLRPDAGGEVWLGGVRCVAPVTLLREDVIWVDGHRVEVEG